MQFLPLQGLGRADSPPWLGLPRRALANQFGLLSTTVLSVSPSETIRARYASLVGSRPSSRSSASNFPSRRALFMSPLSWWSRIGSCIQASPATDASLELASPTEANSGPALRTSAVVSLFTCSESVLPVLTFDRAGELLEPERDPALLPVPTWDEEEPPTDVE